MKKSDDIRYMQRALELATRACGRTNPNPVVGAVIVKDGKIIGEGYHKKAGTPHAEIHALNDAGDEARGATIYVSLEPCSHFGRTPPCAHALVKAGIKRAVIATLDPNPKVAGKGLKILINAGVETTVGILEDEAVRLNEVFFKYIQTGQPFVSLKVAMTLDGKIATYNGNSRWITGEDSRQYVHHLRNIYDGIMVGIGTVLMDNPRLNTRLDVDDKRDPVRVIIDGNLDLPLDCNIVKSSKEQRSIVFTSQINNKEKANILTSHGVEIIELGGDPQKLPIEKAIKILGELGICSLLVEGGAEVNGYIIENELVDKIYWFIASKIVGGRSAPSPIGGKGKDLMSKAVELKSFKIERFGQDICIVGYPFYRE